MSIHLQTASGNYHSAVKGYLLNVHLPARPAAVSTGAGSSNWDYDTTSHILHIPGIPAGRGNRVTVRFYR